MKSVLSILLIIMPIIATPSFPVAEIQKNEINLTNDFKEKGSINIYAVISLVSLILAIYFVSIISVGIPTLSIDGPTIAKYISFTILSFLSSIIFGIIAIIKNLKK